MRTFTIHLELTYNHIRANNLAHAKRIARNWNLTHSPRPDHIEVYESPPKPSTLNAQR